MTVGVGIPGARQRDHLLLQGVLDRAEALRNQRLNQRPGDRPVVHRRGRRYRVGRPKTLMHSRLLSYSSHGWCPL